MKVRSARTQLIAPIRARPRVTAGLNKPADSQLIHHCSFYSMEYSPPLIRKKTHAFTAKLKPKARAIYISTGALGT